MVAATRSRPRPDERLVRQTRLGTYTGPVDVVEQLPFDVYVYPDGPGRATSESERRVVRRDGTEICVRYTDHILFPNQYELDREFVVTMGGESVWVSEDLTFRLDTWPRARDTATAALEVSLVT